MMSKEEQVTFKIPVHGWGTAKITKGSLHI